MYKFKLNRVNYLFMVDKKKISNTRDAFERLCDVLKEKGMEPPDLYNRLGVQHPTQTWNNWKNRGIPRDKYELICNLIPDLNFEYLATGKGEKLSNITDILAARNNIGNGHETLKIGIFARVPVVGSAQLGDNGYWCELEYPVGHGDGYVNFAARDKDAYALRCVGDSMKPRIRNGEFVVVEPNYEALPGDDVMLKAVDGRVMVKTYLYTRDGMVHLMSVNEAHPPQSFALDEIDKIHPIAGIANKLAWIKD